MQYFSHRALKEEEEEKEKLSRSIIKLYERRLAVTQEIMVKKRGPQQRTARLLRLECSRSIINRAVITSPMISTALFIISQSPD